MKAFNMYEEEKDSIPSDVLNCASQGYLDEVSVSSSCPFSEGLSLIFNEGFFGKGGASISSRLI